MGWGWISTPFLKKRWGFFIIFWPLFLLFLFLLNGCATPVIKMSKPLPDIVKEYKMFKLDATSLEYLKSGIQVVNGDFITIMAKGTIRGPNWGITPPANLMLKIGETGPVYFYFPTPSANSFQVKETGEILIRTSMFRLTPNFYGHFVVDIIVWKKEDPILIADFLDDMSQNDPNNEVLKDFAKDFKKWKEIVLAEKKAKEEVEETKKAMAALERKEVPAIKEPNKEKQIAEMNERLQKAVQSLKELEELKRKLKEEEEKGRKLADQLARLREEKLKDLKIPPVIAIASPKDGMGVDLEYITISGVVEDEEGITKFEILVNEQLVTRKDQRGLQIVNKDLRKIDFAEKIRIKEGKNQISVIAHNAIGLAAKKIISVQFAKKKEEVWAVVVGVNKYKKFPSLKYAVNDAQEFYRYLTEVNRIPKDHTWLLLDEEATLNKLRSTLGTHLRRQAGKNDMVIIYLAAHGATEKDASSPDGDGLEKYILPHDADPKDLYSTAMPMSEVARIFQRINSERLVFISDTCYSGASGGRTVPVLGMRANVSGAFLDRLSQGKGRVIITASDANEVSVEKDELKHGVFTYYLLEALRGKGDSDGDGLITVDEAYRYVSTKVPQATGQEQHPVKKGEMKGEIILGVVK